MKYRAGDVLGVQIVRRRYWSLQQCSYLSRFLEDDDESMVVGIAVGKEWVAKQLFGNVKCTFD